MANDKILATFRIDPEKWEAFKALATSSGKNASAALLDFIDGCLDANQISSTKSDNNRDSVDPNIDNIDGIEQRLLPRIDESIDARLEAHIDRIEQRLDKARPFNLDNLDNMIDKRIEACIDDMRSQLEELRGKLTAR